MAKKKNIKEKEKKSTKNYFILAFIYLCCIGITLYFCKWYDVYKEYERKIPVIRGSLTELSAEELDHYVVDIPNTIIYMCTATDDNCRKFEKDFKKYIARNDISDEITYLNLTNIDLGEFVKTFNNKYSYKIKLNGHYPAFVVFQDGKVTSILQGSKNKDLTISKVKDFLELYLLEDIDETNEEEGE